MLPGHNSAPIFETFDLPSPADSRVFWEEVRRRGTPYISWSGNERSVTFFYRSGTAAQVYLEANRLTDKHRIEQGRMNLIADTDVWWATLDVDADSVFSYGFRALANGAEGLARAVALQRRAGIPAVADPFNRGETINANGTGPLSVCFMDEASTTGVWDGAAAQTVRGKLTQSAVRLPAVGRTARQWMYTPAPGSPKPLRLLVLADPEIWFGRLHLAAALESAVASGEIEPVAAVGIATRDHAERLELLGANHAFVDDLASVIVPAARSALEETNLLRGLGETVLAGQSLGGLTALLAALRKPEVFGTVLAHSPSLWWMPDSSVTPANYTHGHQPWITGRFAREPGTSARIDLRVGTREDITNDHVDQLQEILLDRGYDSASARFSGGHDFACWRHALIEGLKEN